MTFVEWIYPDLDDYSGKSTLADRPVSFDGLTKNLVDQARSNGCIFARKFRACNIDNWVRLVLEPEMTAAPVVIDNKYM